MSKSSHISRTVFVSGIALAMSCIVFAATLIVVTNSRRHHDEYAYLKTSGQRIAATIVGIRKDNHIRINYQSPYIIVSQWTNPATHTTYTFTSRRFWDENDPAFQLRNRVTIDVYIEPQNVSHYYVDLSSVGLQS